MDATTISEWLDQHVWPQIQAMMLNDAYFKLMGRARELTGEFNGPIAGLIEMGYVTSQTIAIRRLCDKDSRSISLMRTLDEAKKANMIHDEQFTVLLGQLNSCGPVCTLVNKYVAHTDRTPPDWNLSVTHLTDAQKALCQVAIALDHVLPNPKNYVKLIPVPQFDIMQEFRSWVPDERINELWKFWHAHNDAVNAWILQSA